MKRIFNVLSTVCIIGLVNFSSCKKDLQNPSSSATNVSSMNDMQVPPNFEYATGVQTNFNIKTLDYAGNVLPGVRVDIYSDFPTTGGVFIFSGVSGTDGYFRAIHTLPSYYQNVVLCTKFIGYLDKVKVPVLNGKVNYVYGGVIPSNKKKGRQLTPKSTNSSISFLGSYDDQGVPSYLVQSDVLDGSFLNDLNAALPDGQSVPYYHPEYIANTPTDISLTQASDVFVTFAYEGAGYENTLGFYTYSLTNPPTSASQISNITVIFPNASIEGGGGGLYPGNKVKIGTFPAGTGIGWVIFANGWDGSSVTAGVGTYYSNPAFNPESDPSLRRHNVLLHDATRNLYILGFEDLNREQGSDNDFEDVLFYIKANPSAIDSTNMPPVPHTLPDTDGDGIADQFDAYPNDATKAFNNYFPSQTNTGTLAFEDLWPSQGDYDFNDVVVDYRFNQVANAENKVVEIDATLIVRATGASFTDGFGFQLPVVPSAVTSVTGAQLTEGLISVGANGTELNQSKAVVIAFDNAFKHIKNQTGVNNNGNAGINTSVGGVHGTPDTLHLVIKLASPLDASVLGAPPYNPFIIVNKQRGVEVHLPDNAPTSLANVALLGTNKDNSIPASGRYYKTSNNLPWAINIAERFDYPIEKADIVTAYLKFAAWAQSGGVSYTDWYKTTGSDYRNNSLIYQSSKKK